MKFRVDSILVVGENQSGDTQYDVRYSILGKNDEVIAKHQAPLINAYDRDEMIKKLRIRITQRWKETQSQTVDVNEALGKDTFEINEETGEIT